jgi:hypothetical protein
MDQPSCEDRALTQPIDVDWQASVPASCFHVAQAMLLRPADVDQALCGALIEPAQELERALREEHIELGDFLLHVVPLAAGNLSMKELAEVALTKILGRREVPFRLLRFQGLLTELMNAFAAALPELLPDLEAGVESFRRRWNYHGAALLAGVANWTEPSVLVAEATVVLVHPALGGGGVAHLPYNLARIEAVSADPVPELPETLRLAWLLSMLNLDLPAYREGITPKRLDTVAGLAMIPVVLSAAEGVELAKCDEQTMALALRTWPSFGEVEETHLAPLCQWWDVYRTMRLPWAEALKALERLLEEGAGS